MKGELAVWLWRANALRSVPADIADPYAMEIAGDWRAAATAWHAFGCLYEHAIVLACYGEESEQREALAIFTRLAAAPQSRQGRQIIAQRFIAGLGERKKVESR